MTNWNKNWNIADQADSARSGGQGSVVRVREINTCQIGALKRLHPVHQASTERRFRMQQEVNALLALDGKGAPKILESNLEYWQDKSVPLWAVMEWIPGKTLQEYVKNRPLALDEAIWMTDQILLTIDECQKLGIHHRDLKHDNLILREGDLQPVLVDFGMSWTRPSAEEEHDFKTGLDQEIGNRFLRLPEHGAGRHIHNDASDLSMVIGLLFYMLTTTAPRALQDANGRMPHETNQERFGAVLMDPRWPRLRRVFGVAFHPMVEQRFQSAQDIITRLRDLTPPPPDRRDDAWREELARIEDLRNSELGRKIEATKEVLMQASHRFLTKYHGHLQGTGFVSGGGGPNLVEGNRAAEFQFMIVPQGGSNPSVSYNHRVELNRTEIAAIVTIEGECTETYFKGLATDPEALYEAVEGKVGPVLALLLKKMHAKLTSLYAR